MSNDSRYVLAQLTRTGIWSKWCNLLKYKHLVLEADSVITHLCQYCANKHVQRQRSLSKSAASLRSLDFSSATLINYQELARLYELLLDYFAQYAIELVIVYRGKHLEAPLFGLVPAQFGKNSQRTSERLLAMIAHENSLALGTSGNSDATAATSKHNPRSNHLAAHDRMRPARPNLALILFKQVVNARQTHLGRARIQCHQAFYCPYPTCAKLARDFQCPVMTNDGDFVVMDVRAGFMMFEEFFATYLMSNGSVLRHSSSASLSGKPLSPSLSMGSLSSVSSMARNQLAPGPAGRGSSTPVRSPSMMNLTESKLLFQQGSSSSNKAKSPTMKPMPKHIMARFHFHRSFLIQHPGLNSSLALQLFPLTSGEFLVRHAKSLVRLRIYTREYHKQDLIVATSDEKSFRKYHMAAGRLEHVLRFLCAKDADVVPNLVRGEASRIASSIEQDYHGLHDYYSVSYHFKGRLKQVLRLKGPLDIDQANYVERCLLKRECTADFWLSLLCSSLGQLSSVDYNKTMQFEDLQTSHSARSMLDRPKSLMMTLLSGDDKLYRGAKSKTLTEEQQRQLDERFSAASLTVIDRQGRQLIERTVSARTVTGDHQLSNQQRALFDQLRARIPLSKLAKQNKEVVAGKQIAHRATASDGAAMMNLVFDTTGDMTNLANLLDRSRGPTGGRTHELLRQQVHLKEARQLAILLSLHRYSLKQASRDDQYFKQHYLSVSNHFEEGLINHHLYYLNTDLEQASIGAGGGSATGVRAPTSRTSLCSVTSGPVELRQLFDRIHKYDLENVTNLKALMEAETGQVTPSRTNRNKSARKALKSSTSVASEGAQMVARQKSSASNKESPTNNDNKHSLNAIHKLTKLIRHLVEILDSSLEAYCELNAFLSYPLPQFQLQHYNPILLFNLTLSSYLQRDDYSATSAGGPSQNALQPSRKQAKQAGGSK